ncbi:phosphate acyltransferase PlsX [Kallotenue papyrolyticum]|uniref:phosphate acyltransferase PlsX n=1 Tax=Kallotenue papyrolyticum TaxID=1325125 RepID=UPI0004786474|nr:phosphate acyltransferase PlsX [Kallotenue papyrolyticum]
MRIVLDAIGGDHAPAAPVAGAVQAARELGIELLLVGPRAPIEAELAKHNTAGLRLTVIDAPEVIAMDEHPAQAVRRKKQSSVAVGLRLVRDGEAAAFVSAGHSGATMAGAVLLLGRIAGIERPALTTVFPALKGAIVVADVGANTDSKPEYLVQWARMASLYARLVLGIAQPRVALLANGEEDTKGDRLVQETHALLKGSHDRDLIFVGNAEPKDALVGDVADVLIADGFVGNLFLKTAEAVARFAVKRIQREVRQPAVAARALAGLLPAAALIATSRDRGKTALAALLGVPAVLSAALAPALLAMARSLDYRRYGGAPLLGVNGVVIIAHGKSDAAAIASAIRRASEAVERGLVAAIADSVALSTDGRP